MGKLFFIGDSITVGAWDARGGWANRLIGEIMAETIEANFAPGAFYCMPYNLGLSGDTVPSLIQRLEREILPRIDTDAANESVQIVYAIGVNDTQYLVGERRCRFDDKEFKDSLDALIHLSQKITPHLSFIGLLPVDEDLVNPMQWAPDKSYLNCHIQRFDAIIADTCQSYALPHCPMFDAWHVMPDYRDYFIDGVHPNSKGHALMAEQLRDFIINDTFHALHREG